MASLIILIYSDQSFNLFFRMVNCKVERCKTDHVWCSCPSADQAGLMFCLDSNRSILKFWFGEGGWDEKNIKLTMQNNINNVQGEETRRK